MGQSTAEEKSNNLDKGMLENKHAEELFNLTFDYTNMCVQCGYCLPVCPTYETMNKETQSPRGRINLVKLASLDKIDILDHLFEPIDLCVGCRACEVACPVGVPYGKILDGAKQIIAKAEKEDKTKKKPFSYRVKSTVLNNVFPYPKRLRTLGNLVWVYQKLHINKLARKTKIIEKISKPMAELEKVVPILESPSKRLKTGTVIEARGEVKGRVAFFVGCVSDAVMYKINRLSIELIAHAGFEVVIPEKQKCCGALHQHQGEREQTLALAKSNIEAFEKSGADYYINNAGGCGAMLKEYDHLFEKDEKWALRARNFVNNSKDISEILVEAGTLPFKREWHGAITYQDSCHLRNVQGVYKEPRKLLQSIPGAEYIELEDSQKCCGSGGIYNIIHFNEAAKMLNLKMKKIQDTQAATVVTANPGCYLQISSGIEQHNLEDVKTMHLVEVLAYVCGIDEA